MLNIPFLQNPVTVKELRSRMRGRRAFVVLTVYLLLMSAFVSLVYLGYAVASNSPFGPDLRLAGKTIFATVVGLEVLLVIYIGPSFTAGAITGEKERQTYNLLRTTLLPARSLVSGKLVSSLGYVLLLIFAALPLQSIAFLLGGVALVEVVVAQLLIIVSAVAFALIGLFFSSVMRSTLAASVSTFAAALFLTFGLPAAALIALPILSASFVRTPLATPTAEILLAYGGLALAATNLPITLVVSELFLLEMDIIFFAMETVAGRRVLLISPWLLYLLLYSLLAVVLYVLTVARVKKIPDK